MKYFGLESTATAVFRFISYHLFNDSKMEHNDFPKHSELLKLPKDSTKAIKFIMELLLNYIYPLISRISNALHNCTSEALLEENVVQIRHVYTLCTDQVKKCILTLIEVIKLENYHKVYLQESRNCTLERVSWCYNKLLSIEGLLNKPGDEIDFDNPIFASAMYFVNWIDQTFDLLNKLSTIVYETVSEEKEELYSQWKSELVDNVCVLHTSIDELLLSTMTLCKYCLSVDQPIVRARCQVVLRETKALLGDLIDGDLNTVKATTETLKLPIKPSNVNVLIDVLKDVLYVLETNTNSALLGLVVHCFSQRESPAAALRQHLAQHLEQHLEQRAGRADADARTAVKQFDLHNDRLLQIGSFAMSCSTDQKRILALRGGLASLEALDPHLVPAVMASPDGLHSSILINIWNQEVKQIRDCVFLIVDPAAFTDKVKQMMHQKVLEITDDNSYDDTKTCAAVALGGAVRQLCRLYERHEPAALAHAPALAPLLRDLSKVEIECKIVSELLRDAGGRGLHAGGRGPHAGAPQRTATFNRLLKRLKLLYALIKRINNVLNPSENDDFYEEPDIKNSTRTVRAGYGDTFVNSPRKITNNITRSTFARSDWRSRAGRAPLPAARAPPTRSDLSFSVRLDQICNISDIKVQNRETSILYPALRTRRSLRSAVLCHGAGPHTPARRPGGAVGHGLLDETTLQITDVLNQINDLTCNASPPRRTFDSTDLFEKSCNIFGNSEVTLNDDVELTCNVSVGSVGDVTPPSDADSLDRLHDLDLVETKLSELKSGQFETSL